MIRRRRRGGAALITAAVLAAGVVGLLVRLPWRPLTAWDGRIDADAHHDVLHHAVLLSAVRASTHVGDPAVVTAATFVLAAVLGRRRWRWALYLLVVRALAVAVSSGAKAAVARHRPVLLHPVAHAGGHSFPSGHALGSAALWGSVAVLVWLAGRRWRRLTGTLAVVVPAAVGATRVLLGVHFPTDVVAGLLLGWACAAGAAALLRADVARARPRALP